MKEDVTKIHLSKSRLNCEQRSEILDPAKFE